MYSDYQIVENIDDNCIFNFERYLFNEPSHLASQPCEDFTTFYLRQNNLVLARWSIFFEKNTAFSPYVGTFGSIEFAIDLNKNLLNRFIQQVEKKLIERDINQITIKHYPFCYQNKNSEILTKCLLDNNYQTEIANLNFHINITDYAFEKIIKPSEKRRINKCISNGFYFNEEINPDLLQVYNFIKESRERKGFPISLPYKKLEELFFQFRKSFKVFTINDQKNIIALTIVIHINDKILYNFYPADCEKYLKFSPMVQLIEGLYNFCQENKIEILDMGIATDKGVPNFGLIKFKENIGAQPSLKLSFKKLF